MKKLQQWKDDAFSLAKRYEAQCTFALILIALVLIGIALWGKAHHKAGALLWIAI